MESQESLQEGVRRSEERRCPAAGLEGGGRGYEPRPLEAEKGKKTDSPQEFSPADPSQTSDLQKYKRISVYCLKPLTW